MKKPLKQAGADRQIDYGLALKIVSPGLDGMPDRIVFLLHGKMVFVEIKTHGNKKRPLQVRRKSQLESLGFSVYRLDDAT